MAPTPPSINFQNHFRNFGRARRRGNTNPYDAAHSRTTEELVTPLDFPEEEDGEREADGETEPEVESGGDEGQEGEEEVSGDDDTDPAFEDDEEEEEEEEEEAFKVEEEGGIHEASIVQFSLCLISGEIPSLLAMQDFTHDPIRPSDRSTQREQQSEQHRTQVNELLARLEMRTNESLQAVPMEIDQAFNATALGLKEISNLASWTVSSSKPGCGVEALRDEDTGLFWQSDGPQPHHLNIHFSRMVSIRAIRIFLNYQDDESYTPTKISLLAGTGYHDLIPFAALEFTHPKGWIPVSLDNVGGGEDGKTLRAFLVQIKIVENHQNGKDTHVRGLKIYARDERAGRSGMGALVDEGKTARKATSTKITDATGFHQPAWMREPEIR